MKGQKVVYSKSVCAQENLEIELELMNRIGVNERVLFLWRCSPTVVIGRFQNPWKEVNLKYAKNHEISVIRRKSGGGTVYLDFNCPIFSFITGSRDLQIKKNQNFLRGLIREKTGLETDLGDKGDIYWNEYKISGAGFRQSRNAHLHHMTLLLPGTNFDHMSNVLFSPLEKLISGRERLSRRAKTKALEWDIRWVELIESLRATEIQLQEINKNLSLHLFRDTPRFQIGGEEIVKGFYKKINELENPKTSLPEGLQGFREYLIF